MEVDVTTPYIDTACRTIRRTSRYEQRRYVRAMAWHYERERHLEGVLGVYMLRLDHDFLSATMHLEGVLGETPYGPIEDTRRIIRRLGGILHRQVMSSHPFRRRRISWTRKALFGECYTLWHLEQETAE